MRCDTLTLVFIEVWTDEFPITFDGLVLEVFNRDTDRWHVTQVKEIKVEQSRKGKWQLTISAFPHGGMNGFGIPDRSVPLVATLVAEVNRARQERYSLGPVTT